MIVIKSARELKAMELACRISANVLKLAGTMVEPGVTTWEIDQAVRKYIEKQGAKPSFLGYGDYPASSCISVNNVVIHGIPSKKQILKDGDIVKIDTGATYRGYVGDSARTIPVGNVSIEAKKLIQVTRDSFWAGVEKLEAGNRLGDVGSAIDTLVRQNGFSTVKRYVGHGIGTNLHEQPDVPNFGTPGRGIRLSAGMTLAIEPMVNVGRADVIELNDGWTVKTADRSLSAHYENTVALTSNGVLILTEVEKGF